MTLMQRTFKQMVDEAQREGRLPEGKLAVVYDKGS
jgi:hypothetical protein